MIFPLFKRSHGAYLIIIIIFLCTITFQFGNANKNHLSNYDNNNIDYIKSVYPEIASELPSNFEYIDENILKDLSDSDIKNISVMMISDKFKNKMITYSGDKNELFSIIIENDIIQVYNNDISNTTNEKSKKIKNIPNKDKNAYKVGDFEFVPLNNYLLQVNIQNIGKNDIYDARFVFGNVTFDNVSINTGDNIIFLVRSNFTPDKWYNYKFTSDHINVSGLYYYDLPESDINLSISLNILQNNILEFNITNENDWEGNLPLTVYFGDGLSYNLTLYIEPYEEITWLLEHEYPNGDYELNISYDNTVHNFNINNTESQLMLESFGYINNELYEIVFNNHYPTTQMVEFYLGEDSHSSIFEPNERKVFLVENNNPNLSIKYKNYGVD